MHYAIIGQNFFPGGTKIFQNFKGGLTYFKGRNFRVFANFRQNRESLIPRIISKSVIHESVFSQKNARRVHLRKFIPSKK